MPAGNCSETVPNEIMAFAFGPGSWCVLQLMLARGHGHAPCYAGGCMGRGVFLQLPSGGEAPQVIWHGSTGGSLWARASGSPPTPRPTNASQASYSTALYCQGSPLMYCLVHCPLYCTGKPPTLGCTATRTTALRGRRPTSRGSGWGLRLPLPMRCALLAMPGRCVLTGGAIDDLFDWHSGPPKKDG